MLSIDWRVPEEYRYTAKIPAAGFAWEYLRRNDEYRHDFDTLTATKQPARQELEMFARRWGLRFRFRPRRAA